MQKFRRDHTDPATWSALGWKDANQALKLTIEAAKKGTKVPVAFLQIRDLKQFHYQVPHLSFTHYLTKSDVMDLITPSTIKYSFFTPQNINAYLVDYVGGTGTVTLDILKDMVAYQNSLSPLTHINIIPQPPIVDYGMMELAADTYNENGIIAGQHPYEIGIGLVKVANYLPENTQWFAAASELLSGTTQTLDLYLYDNGLTNKVDIDYFLFGVSPSQMCRGSEFTEIGKQVAGISLNMDRGIWWKPPQ